MGISSLSMDTSPLMAKEREQYVLTEDNHSKTEHSNWLQSIRTFNKERMGISSLSMDTSPLMAKEREQYVLTEDNHSKTEHSNWLQSIRTFNKERQNDQEQREDGIYFDPPSFLEPSKNKEKMESILIRHLF